MYAKKSIILLIILLISGINTSLKGQSIVKSTASAKLLNAIAISTDSPLNFGTNVLTSTEGGTVILPSNSNVRNYTGGLTSSPSDEGPTIAAYNVNGTGLETYAVVLPSATTVTHTSISTGNHTMNINLMKARFNGADTDATTSTLSEDGTDSFTLGGTLNVQGNQVVGKYAGTFQVSVDYN
jgi:hypothetical protein